MQAMRNEIVGFVQLRVGSREVQVPVRSIDPALSDDEGPGPFPLAAFTVDGKSFSIIVRGTPGTPAVERAVQAAAHDALRHLSRTLLN